jgi:hypothetical protein
VSDFTRDDIVLILAVVAATLSIILPMFMEMPTR